MSTATKTRKTAKTTKAAEIKIGTPGHLQKKLLKKMPRNTALPITKIREIGKKAGFNDENYINYMVHGDSGKGGLLKKNILIKKGSSYRVNPAFKN